MSEEEERRRRRDARRTSLVFGRAETAAMEAVDAEFWRGVSLADKFQATLELVRDSWTLQGNHGPPPRLDRSVGGVRALRG